MTLPGGALVVPGHGPLTTIGREAAESVSAIRLGNALRVMMYPAHRRCQDVVVKPPERAIRRASRPGRPPDRIFSGQLSQCCREASRTPVLRPAGARVGTRTRRFHRRLSLAHLRCAHLPGCWGPASREIGGGGGARAFPDGHAPSNDVGPDTGPNQQKSLAEATIRAMLSSLCCVGGRCPCRMPPLQLLD